MDFNDFILKQMKRAGISHRNAEKIYAAHKDIFVQAFTHKSADPVNNYDMLEAFGDMVINGCLFDIIHTKHPELDQGTITLAFQKAKAEETLSIVGEEQDFFPHIRMSEEYKKDCLVWRDLLKNPVKYTCFTGSVDRALDIDKATRFTTAFIDPSNEKEDKYKKALEDTVESFCGAMCKAVNLYFETHMGTGVEAVFKWAKPIVDSLTFDCTNVLETRNIKQQMKEYWDTVYAVHVNDGRKITNQMMYWHDKKKSKPGQTVMHVTDPDPVKRGHRRILASVIGPNQKYAQLYAAQLAFPIIQKEYEYAFQKGYAFKQSLKSSPKE